MKPAHHILIALSLLTMVPSWAHDNHAPATAVAAPQQKPWGIAGRASQVKRTITLTMTDNMRFTPDRIDVKRGETVHLRVRNSGQLLHELVIGTRADLEAHAAMMARHPDMAHDEPHMVHVKPGQTGEIIWTFNRAGEFEFACLIAGHFQAGMKGAITVR